MRHISDPVYGAVLDGVADDTAAVQLMLDAGPGSSSIAGAKIRISAPLVLRTGTRLDAHGARVGGSGGHSLIRNFAPEDSFTGHDGHGDITLEGGIWDARGELAAPEGPHAGAAWNAMTFAKGRRIVVRDLEIRNVASYHAVEVNACDGALIDNVTARGFLLSLAHRVFSEAFQIDVAASPASSDLGEWDGTHSRDVTVRACYAGPSLDYDPSAGTGLGPFGALAGSHTHVDDRVYDGIRILDNVCEGALKYGVRAHAWRDPVIRGNTITGAGTNGVLVELGAGGIVSGNVIASTASNAVNVTDTDGVIVADNTIRDTATNYGIYLSATNATAVTGNRVEAAATAGLRFGTGATFCMASGNTIVRGVSAGVVAISAGAGAGTVNTAIHNQLVGYTAASVAVSSGTVVVVPPAAGSAGSNVR
ncbi:right-handed parallel beta-helix repeat-containing protein [Phytomonospora endophytica]|uniref:Right handed beta helix domain-containing protein n=1 Tax=Phytomonospora endophytica TaxID=714109 RepID=A0A841FPX7_9ACTN|nr:right-handed parallel beta-helix repeat-containing protein [Phytomonospora endophytica]MBB6037884.1 hypothetical protein [Phytomonospora endophytica]GIG68783.1 hypothetical protein Pen01_50780 [Phytomonospora endophytica]